MGQIYPPPSARPLFKGLLYWHAKTQSAREISKTRNTRTPLPSHFLFPPLRKPTSAPSGHLLPKEGGREHTHYPLHKSLPRVGKVASEARRIGGWRYENERDKASQVSEMRTPLPSHSLSPRCGSQPPPLRGSSFQRKEGECRPSPPSPYGESGDRRVPFFPLSSFRANARNLFRSRSSKSRRTAGSGKHRVP